MTAISYGVDSRYSVNAFDVLAVQQYGLEKVASALHAWWKAEANRLPSKPLPNLAAINRALHIGCLTIPASELNSALKKGGMDIYWPAEEGYLS